MERKKKENGKSFTTNGCVIAWPSSVAIGVVVYVWQILVVGLCSAAASFVCVWKSVVSGTPDQFLAIIESIVSF